MNKKIYRLLALILLVFSYIVAKPQCLTPLVVTIDAIPRQNICKSESVDLLAKTNLATPVPTVCALNPSLTCPSGSIDTVKSIGAGSIINSGQGSAGPELFGDFGEAQSRSQIIILASELAASGFVGGTIYSLTLDIGRFQAGTNHTIPNLSIKMGCNSVSSFTNSFYSGLLEVFSPKTVTLTTTGLRTFTFDQAFDWDGQSNIIIEFCFFSPAGTGFSDPGANFGTYTKDHSPGFSCWRRVTASTSNGDCIVTGGTEKNFNQRPNIKFNVCKPKTVNLTYAWTPGPLANSTTNRVTASPSANTTYFVTVTKPDEPGCSVTQQITITVDDPSLFTPTVNTPICEGSTLQFQANTTGVSYFWSGPNSFGRTTQNPTLLNATPAASGTYTFIVDNGNCTATKTLIVDVQKTPNTGVAKDSTICRSIANLNLFGLLTNEDPGGTWTDDNNSTILTGGSLNPSLLNNAILPATFNYTYKITNVCGTVSTTVKVTVIPTRSPGVDDDTTLCETGSSVDLFTILDQNPTSGGSWTENNATGQMTPSGIFSPSNLGPGTYTFNYTVTGTFPCANLSSKVTVVVRDQPYAGDDNAKVICTNSSINLFNQLLNSPKPGGTWKDVNNSGGNLNTATGAYTATAVNAGVYSFVYKVAGQAPCVADSSMITLTVKGPPQISNVVTTCAPDKATYTTSFDLTNGDPSTYAVDIPGGTFSGSNPVVYTSAPIPDATSATFKVTDGNSCTFSTTTVLKRCACPTQAGTINRTDTIHACNGNPFTATYDGGYISDGNDTLMYVLHTGSGAALGTVIIQQSSPTIVNYSALPIVQGQVYYLSPVAGNRLGNNLVDVSDQCLSVTQGVPVVFGTIGAPSFTFSSNPACPGSNVTLTSSVTGSPNYSWTGPSTFTSPFPNPTVNNISAASEGLYTLTVSSNGCSLSTSRTLTIVTIPTVTLTADTEICAGQCGNIYIGVNAAGPIRVVYAVTPGTSTDTLLSPGLHAIEVCPVTNVTYSLVYAYFPGGGCGFNLTGGVSVKVVPVPTASFNVVGDSAFCYNEANTGKVVFHLQTGLTANLIYSLNNVDQPSRTVINNDEISVPATTPGITKFELESMALTSGTCKFVNNNAPISFYNLSDPVVTAGIDKSVLCSNDSVKLSFTVSASAKVAIDYMVGSTPKTVITSKDTVVYVKFTGSGTLTIQKASYLVKPSCSRNIGQTFTILANPVPVPSISVTNTACNNTNTGVISVSTNDPTNTYRLDQGLYVTDSIFGNLFSGFHDVSVKAANGCIVTQRVEVIAVSNLTLVSNIIHTSCGYADGQVNLSVTNGKAPYTILFNGKEYSTFPIKDVAAGTYPVLVIDKNSCVVQKDLVVLPSIPIVMSLTDNGLIDCTAPEYSAVFVSAKGGTGNYTFSVPGRPIQSDSVFHGLFPQTYIVTVTDDRGCKSSKQIKLNSIQKFTISPIIRKQLLCWEDRDAQILVNTINATLPLEFSLTNVNDYTSNNLFENVGPGNFTVYVRERGGCHREQSVSFGVTRPEPIDLEVLSSGPPACFNTADGFIVLKATGGSLADKYYTINGADTNSYKVDPNFTGVSKGNHILIAKDGNGCHSDTINFYLDGPDDIILSAGFTFNAGKTLAELTINATGGTPDYVYSIDNVQYKSNNVFSNLKPGIQTYCVKDKKDCLVCQTINLSADGVAEIDLSTSVLIFPNPFSDAFTLSSETELRNVSIRILNSIGEEVYTGNFDSLNKQPKSIKPTVSMAAGIYTLELHSDQGASVKKLIKQ